MRAGIDEPRTWQRVRRYAVPEAMIEACRAADDWRAACAAGRIDTDLDLAAVRREHGARAAEAIEADLDVLAPDLLRWHLPRALGGRTSLVTHRLFLLSARAGRIQPGDPVLVAHSPKTVDGSQRLRLTVAAAEAGGHHIDLPPPYWSAAHVSGLAAAFGGSPARMPGFEADGSIRPDDAYATRIDPADPASRTEFAERCQRDDYPEEAWRAQGIELEVTVRAGTPADQVHRIGQLTRVRLAGLAAECHRLSDRYGLTTLFFGDRWRPAARIDRRDDGTLTAVMPVKAESRERRLIPTMLLDRPVDLDLLRLGLITIGDLHPLVRTALFPGAPAGDPPPPARPVDVTVPVRCGSEWHTVTHREGRLELPSHTADEIRREETLRALGGVPHGCFRTRAAWHSGAGRLPRALRLLRRDAWLRIQHGGAPVLMELLDAGLDPLVVDGRGNNLLHQLRAVDHTELLPRLLTAGVPINGRNKRGRTPLHVAVGDGGSPELVRALLDAGADPLAPDDSGVTTVEMSGWKSEGYDEDEDDGDHRPQALIHQLLLERTAK